MRAFVGENTGARRARLRCLVPPMRAWRTDGVNATLEGAAARSANAARTVEALSCALLRAPSIRCRMDAFHFPLTTMATRKPDAPVTITPPEEADEERLAHLVKDAARAYIRALQLRLAEHSVSYGHWTILRILWRHDGLSQRELSERAGVTEPTTFAAVKALEALGYVERTHLPGNKKKVHVFLSKTGRALRRKLEPLATEVNALSVEGVSEQDVATTRRVLITIAKRLVADEIASAENGRRVPSTQEVGRLLSDL